MQNLFDLRESFKILQKITNFGKFLLTKLFLQDSYHIQAKTTFSEVFLQDLHPLQESIKK